MAGWLSSRAGGPFLACNEIVVHASLTLERGRRAIRTPKMSTSDSRPSGNGRGGPAQRADRGRAVWSARRASDLREDCRKTGGDLEQIKFLLGHSSIQTTERYLGSEQEIAIAVNDSLGFTELLPVSDSRTGEASIVKG